MSDINSITLIGRLTRDPELKVLDSGLQIVNVSIANNQKYNNKDNVSFFDCTAFGKLAEIIAQYCHKGSKIAIEGRLTQQRWEKDGKQNSRISITINNMQMLDGRKQETEKVEGQIDNPFSDDDIPF